MKTFLKIVLKIITKVTMLDIQNSFEIFIAMRNSSKLQPSRVLVHLMMDLYL